MLEMTQEMKIVISHHFFIFLILVGSIHQICYGYPTKHTSEGDSKIVRGPEFPFEWELEAMSMDEYLIASAQNRIISNPTFLVNAETKETLSIEDFLQQSQSLAAELQELKCGKNTIVGVMAENQLETPVVILGTVLTGAAVTMYNPKFSVDELRLIYSIAKPSIVFCSKKTCNKVREVVSQGTKIIALYTDPSADNSRLRNFSSLIQSSKTPEKVKNEPDNTVCILHSSGTTGLPKGVMLTHKNMVFVLALMKMNIVENNGPMTLVTTTMNHISGWNTVFNGVVRNETVVFMPTFDVHLFLNSIKEYQLRRLLLLPSMINFLLKSPTVHKSNLSSVEFVFAGAASISAATEQAMMSKFDLKYIQQIYGLTESTMYTLIKQTGSLKGGTVGGPVPGLQIKVVDTKTGEILGKNQQGEIYIKGPSVMKGYFGNEKATAETIDKDGWLHSGDIGFYDDANDFYIVDRAKDMIKVGGAQVSPAELESFLLDHPSITDTAVIGIPNEDYGEVPRAYVVKRAGDETTSTEISQYIEGKVLPYKKLQGGVEFRSDIPRNPTGKIMKQELKNLWKAERAKQIEREANLASN